MQYPNFLTKDPPSIHQWLYDFLAGRECLQFPVLPYVGIRTTNVIAVSTVLLCKKNTLVFTLSSIKKESIQYREYAYKDGNIETLILLSYKVMGIMY